MGQRNYYPEPLRTGSLLKDHSGGYTNKEMQKEFNEIGEKGYSFDILVHLKPKEDMNYDYTEELKTLEEMWIEKLQPFNEKGYNKIKIR